MNPRKLIISALPTLAINLALGSFLAILGPYQTNALGWPNVWFYWTGLISFGWVCGHVVSLVLRPVSAHWHPLITHGLASIFVALPVTLAVSIIQFKILNGNPEFNFLMLFFFVWVISAGVTVLTWLLSQKEAQASEAKVGSSLLDKMPHNLRHSPIWALESEDHYLRIHTGKGDALILMRLSDAIAAVETLDGARTHRSWWVAKDAIKSVSRGDGRAVLTLLNNVEAPVSRTYSPKLRDAGWF